MFHSSFNFHFLGFSPLHLSFILNTYYVCIYLVFYIVLIVFTLRFWLSNRKYSPISFICSNMILKVIICFLRNFSLICILILHIIAFVNILLVGLSIVTGCHFSQPLVCFPISDSFIIIPFFKSVSSLFFHISTFYL